MSSDLSVTLAIIVMVPSGIITHHFLNVNINIAFFALVYLAQVAIFVFVALLDPSFNFMTTHPILSYPINSGLKEFQFFKHEGKIYYVINDNEIIFYNNFRFTVIKAEL